MTEPTINADKLHQLLLEGQMDAFNEMRSLADPYSLRGRDLQGVDLRGLNGKNIDLRDCCLKHTDLRDIDLSHANLEGASIHSSKIAGTLFPKALSAEEITLSLLHGTRMRYQ